MSGYSRTLQRQLRKLNLSADQAPDTDTWQQFLKKVDTTYTEYRNGRYLMERSLDLSSQEMQALNESLKQESQEKIEALKKSQEKSRFLANMSHEIRTPMNGVLGMLDLLSQTALNEKQHDYLYTAQSSSELLLEVINSVLDLSKVESGKLTLEKTPFQLSKMTQETTLLFSGSAKKKGLELLHTLPEIDHDMFYGDPIRMRQVLGNLIGNAIKFTNTGSVELLVEQLTTTSENSTLRFTVNDTGMGISKPQQAAIFSAFTQADESTTRQYGGTGLGLTISQELIKLMGGHIGVDSTPDNGSSFFFELTLEKAPINQPQLSDSVQKKQPRATASHRKTGHLLLVEDNLINIKVASAILRKLGYSFDTAQDGLAAVKQLEAHVYDVVLMDCQLPEIDGYEATRRFRAFEQQRGETHTPVIALTANAMQDDKQICINAGMDDYLSKPIAMDVIDKKLQTWLQKGKTSINAKTPA